jgi:hypothetical protein
VLPLHQSPSVALVRISHDLPYPTNFRFLFQDEREGVAVAALVTWRQADSQNSCEGSSSEEYIFLRTVASSQSPWTEQLAVDPSFGYGIFSSHLAFCVHFLVSWATFQFT